jgi:integrase
VRPGRLTLDRQPRDLRAEVLSIPVTELWKLNVKGAKVRDGPHTCRHTFALHFVAVVLDLRQLAGIVGHSQTRVTELYTHLLPGHLGRARNAVNLSATPKTLAQILAVAS